jgi:hypothetical protein
MRLPSIVASAAAAATLLLLAPLALPPASAAAATPLQEPELHDLRRAVDPELDSTPLLRRKRRRRALLDVLSLTDEAGAAAASGRRGRRVGSSNDMNLLFFTATATEERKKISRGLSSGGGGSKSMKGGGGSKSKKSSSSSPDCDGDWLMCGGGSMSLSMPAGPPSRPSAPNRPSANPPTPPHAPSPSPLLVDDRFEECNGLGREEAFLSVLSTVTPASLLLAPATPQGMAFDWIVNADPAGLDPCTADATRVVQRYALAAFYYATVGDEWTDNAGWLTGPDECQDWTGIACATSGAVTSVVLGA